MHCNALVVSRVFLEGVLHRRLCSFLFLADSLGNALSSFDLLAFGGANEQACLHLALQPILLNALLHPAVGRDEEFFLQIGRELVY